MVRRPQVLEDDGGRGTALRPRRPARPDLTGDLEPLHGTCRIARAEREEPHRRRARARQTLAPAIRKADGALAASADPLVEAPGPGGRAPLAS